jgi:hypothetical protein
MKQRNRACPIDYPIYLDTEMASSSDFLGVFSWTLDPNKRFWFRGHPRIEYTLALWRRVSLVLSIILDYHICWRASVTH